MLTSIKMLKSIIQFDYTPEELGEKLSMMGLEVEGITKGRHRFDGIITGKVKTIHSITDTKLNRAIINVGNEDVQIITTASNLKNGDIVPVALPHSKVASGTNILKKDFKGVASSGMLCSYLELGLDPEILGSKEKEGILIFPTDTPVGEKIEDILPIDDDYLEISLLPDRADAFCLRGVARWIEIIKAKEEDRRADFSQLEEAVSLKTKGVTNIPIIIEDKNLCPFYSGRFIKDVVVTDSLLLLRQKLFMLRIRPINSVVDITNFVLGFYGQPLHAFDADIIKGKIYIRPAKKGEKIKTLDEIERNLSNVNLVIADESGPIAIAGVIGGFKTAVTEKTKNILLESAYFSPRCVARSVRSLGIATDASATFGRCADPIFPSKASIIAANLIAKETCGVPTKDNAVSCPAPKNPVNLRIARIKKILGEKVEKKNLRKYFSFEGFDYIEKKDYFIVTAPSFRADIKEEIDLIEEIVRMKGYNEFGEALIVGELKDAKRTEYENFIRALKEKLVKLGLDEVQTISLVGESSFDLIEYTDKKKLIKLLNPLSIDMAFMRPLLLPTMLSVLERNKKSENVNVSIFEVGKVFYKEKLFKETDELGILLSGARTSKNYLGVHFPYSLLYLKGLFEELFLYYDIHVTFEAEKFSFMHPYQSAGIYHKGEKIGYLGTISMVVLNKLGLTDEVFYGAINVEKLLEYYGRKINFKTFSLYPSVKRDIAIIVDEGTAEKDVKNAILSVAPRELQKITLFDIYKGSPLPEGKKNLAYSLEFSSVDKTLKGEEINKFIKILEETLQREVKGKLRKE
ncbi:MAG: phenylalanine--tRNA ligase subunit beta [Caldisericota bacterium]|nr:phenylalanine--tRNA ligase subunit beta [Caldisericota bacterium]